MEAFRYRCGRLPAAAVGVLAIALLSLNAIPASAAARGGGGDDYLLASPTISVDDFSKAEGNSGKTTFTFTVFLSKPATADIVLDMRTQDGDATVADSDYQPVSTTLTIPAGSTSGTIDVSVNGDTKGENDEPFYMKIFKIISGPPGAAIGDGTGIGNIIDDDGGVVPTLLSTFDAETVENGIALRWQFASTAAIADSWLERADAVAGPWARVEADVRASNGMVEVLDANVASEHTYFYRLAAQMRGGDLARFGPIQATSGVIVKEFALNQITPTPTRGGLAKIDFAVARTAAVRLSVLDVQGRVVSVLVDGVMSAGRHQAVWNAGSTGVRSGVFFVRYETPDTKAFVKRIVVTQ